MECLICQEEFKTGDNVLTHDSNETGKTVAHPYHEECLKKWYKTNSSCPTCRNVIAWDEWVTVVI